LLRKPVSAPAAANSFTRRNCERNAVPSRSELEQEVIDRLVQDGQDSHPARRQAVSRDQARAVASKLPLIIGEYHRRHRRRQIRSTDQKTDSDVRQWIRETVRRIEALEEQFTGRYSGRDPDHEVFSSWLRRPSLVSDLRVTLRQAKAAALEIDRELHSRRRPGRPADWARTVLDWDVGETLVEAGIRVTKSAEGNFALVLEAVYAKVGLSKSDVHRAVKAACNNLPAWHCLKSTGPELPARSG